MSQKSDRSIYGSTGTFQLPPDPEIVRAVTEVGYSIETAVADLIDNSIDAGAKDVVLRFERDNERLSSFMIADNGHGMTRKELKNAMQFAGKTSRKASAIGMFGLGLKSASLSQAGVLTVFSRSSPRAPSGLAWDIELAKGGWVVEEKDSKDAQQEFTHSWGIGYEKGGSGTIVIWESVRAFQAADGNVGPYLTKQIARLQLHLGLHFHRFIEAKRLRICIEVIERGNPKEAVSHLVVPIDPFGYPSTASKKYPKAFVVKMPGVRVPINAEAHIWPKKSKLREFKLGGGVADRQGFYFYRSDRLIQGGGWSGLREVEPHLSLARIKIDLPSGTLFKVAYTKAHVAVPPEFIDVIKKCTSSDGTTWNAYINDAQKSYAIKASPKLPMIAAPGTGILSGIRQAINDAFPINKAVEPIDVKWRKMAKKQFFEIDRDNNELSLNEHYRSALNSGASNSGGDAPMVKTMLYLLTNEFFLAGNLGPILQQREKALQAALIAAVKTL